MSCPDYDRLVRASRDDRADPDLDMHVATCSECRENLRILREIPSLFRPAETVPEELVRKTMRGLDARGARALATRLPDVQVITAALLGLLTALVVVMVAGPPRGGGLESVLVFSALVGVACGAFRAGNRWVS